MNLEELRDSLRELTISIRDCEAQIKRLETAIAESGEKLVKAENDVEKKEIEALMAGKRQDLALVVQQYTSLRENYSVITGIVAKLLPGENFQHSSLHSSLNEGFEYNCRLQLQKELWQLFQVGFADPRYFFKSSRKLVDKNVLDIVKEHYSGNFSEEIDIFLYTNPNECWKLHTSENTEPNLHPFMKKIGETPNWKPALESLNKTAPYDNITPTSSEDALDQEVRQVQDNLRAVATMYMVFEVTHSNKNLPAKLRQLEVQLAYVIVRFHLRINSKIPSDKNEFKQFVALEALKLIAFAGVVLIDGGSKKLSHQAHRIIYEKENPCPALRSLYKTGRLCYFNGATYPSRLSLVESKVEAWGAINLSKKYDQDIQALTQEQRILASKFNRLTDEIYGKLNRLTDEIYGKLNRLTDEISKVEAWGAINLSKKYDQDIQALTQEQRILASNLNRLTDEIYGKLDRLTALVGASVGVLAVLLGILAVSRK
jgi:uncharacterized protein YoxC